MTTSKPAGKAKKPAAKAFAGLGDMLSTGDLGALTSNNGQDFSLISLDEIAVKEQVREIFEDAENSLEDLAESIREHGVFQPIILRPIDGSLPFELVAGERRLRAARLAGLTQIPAMIRDLTDQEADAVQFAENIQRKNLTQIETAKKLQADLDELGGDIEALMAKRQKSRAWISKWLSILDLPEQTQRVVTENVSADLEVINAVKQVEKVSPEAARELVDDLKQSRGKGGKAREKAQAAKDAVKPPKTPRKEKEAPANPGNVATPRDTSHESPGPVKTLHPEDMEKEEQGGDELPASEDIFAHAKKEAEEKQEVASAQNSEPEPALPALPPAEALEQAYTTIFESLGSAATVLDLMNPEQRDDCTAWLRSFYDAGVTAPNVARAVIMGFRSGSFSDTGHAAFALAAFLQGADSDAKFNALDILGTVKP